MIRRLLFAISLIVVGEVAVLAQMDSIVGRFGGFLIGGLNIHRANFKSLPGIPSCCPRFETGDGFGFSLGGYYDYLIDNTFALETQVAYQQLGATLSRLENTTVIVDDIHVAGEFEHSVESNISMIALAPFARYSATSKVSFLIGPEAGLIINNTYSQQEIINKPADRGTFENGRRIRNTNSGQTPGGSKFYAGLSAGIKYRLPLNVAGDLHIVPQLQFTVGLTPLAAGMEWRRHSIMVGASIEQDLLHEVEPLPPPPPPPIVEVDTAITLPVRSTLTAELTAVMIDTDMVEKPIKELVIEEYIRTQNRPLLNFIFFDSGSSLLDKRYHQLTEDEATAFSITSLYTYETLPLYYEMLNVIGRRMTEHTKGRLTIVGCNDNTGIEKENKQLSKERAQVIYQYFRDVWQIPASRMKMEVRNLPEKPSTVNDVDGAQENRRAEIYSNMWEIIEPIYTIDTVHIPKPPVVRFLPKGEATSGFNKWQVVATESNKKLKDFSGKDSLPAILDWELEKEHMKVLAALDTVSAVLSVNDHSGQFAESHPITLPVRHYTLEDKHREGSVDTIISRYSLILFDFDRAELSEANRRIADFVKSRISEDSRIKIFGYTDRIGTDEYNTQLSDLRARATQRYVGLDRAEVKGLGRRILLYDNALPEGRFYSRTVTIVVSTPLKR
jgi:outer membrane protein OmpA-like peptidoglycan-associated protein